MPNGLMPSDIEVVLPEELKNLRDLAVSAREYEEQNRGNVAEADFVAVAFDVLCVVGSYSSIYREKVELMRERNDLRKKYDDLLYCVGKVTVGETRHETARRYILEAEKGGTDACKQA